MPADTRLPADVTIADIQKLLKEHPEFKSLLLAPQQTQKVQSEDWGRPLTLNEVMERTGASRSTLHSWRYELPVGLRLEQSKINGFVRVYEKKLDEFRERFRGTLP